jgi:hypothetical protein
MAFGTKKTSTPLEIGTIPWIRNAILGSFKSFPDHQGYYDITHLSLVSESLSLVVSTNTCLLGR